MGQSTQKNNPNVNYCNFFAFIYMIKVKRRSKLNLPIVIVSRGEGRRDSSHGIDEVVEFLEH